MRSLRRALAVRFSLTMIVALMLIALWAFIGTHRRLKHQLEASLTSAMHLQTATLARRLPIAFQPESADLEGFIRDVNRFVTVRDSIGHVIEANTPFSGGLPVDSASFHRARRGELAIVSQSWANRQIHSLYGPTPPERSPEMAVIQVAASLEPLADADRNILFFMIGTVVLGAVATLVGAAWLAESSVAPVAAITAQARAITAGTLDRRITAHADVHEFNGLVLVLNEMLERLESALQAQRRMIADVGHDLRTPITAMTGQLEVGLRSERTPEEYQRILESCLEEARHMGSISDALVMLARLEARELRPECVDTDLATLASDAVARAREHAGATQILLDAPECGSSVSADPGMVQLVLNQLLDNAVAHTPAGTRVTVTVERNKTHALVAVEDDGPGIPAEDLELLFERFYRQDASRTRSTGAGLGLTIATAIAEAHGGSIHAKQGQRGGLRVELHLPTT